MYLPYQLFLHFLDTQLSQHKYKFEFPICIISSTAVSNPKLTTLSNSKIRKFHVLGVDFDAKFNFEIKIWWIVMEVDFFIQISNQIQNRNSIKIEKFGEESSKKQTSKSISASKITLDPYFCGYLLL